MLALAGQLATGCAPNAYEKICPVFCYRSRRARLRDRVRAQEGNHRDLDHRGQHHDQKENFEWRHEHLLFDHQEIEHRFIGLNHDEEELEHGVGIIRFAGEEIFELEHEDRNEIGHFFFIRFGIGFAVGIFVFYGIVFVVERVFAIADALTAA